MDRGELSIRAGVELSFLSEETQTVVAECAEDCKIDMKTAKKLREAADSEGNIAPDTVHAILYGEDTEPKAKPKTSPKKVQAVIRSTITARTGRE